MLCKDRINCSNINFLCVVLGRNLIGRKVAIDIDTRQVVVVVAGRLEAEGASTEMMGLGWVGAILVGAGWLALGYCFGARYPPARILVSARRLAKQKAVASDDNGKKKKKIKDPLDVEKLADILQDFKMVHISLY